MIFILLMSLLFVGLDVYNAFEDKYYYPEELAIDLAAQTVIVLLSSFVVWVIKSI